MNLENYKISKLPYIENASNEIMEKYNIKVQYETEPPHGDPIETIIINLENEVYASLKEWYIDISFVNNQIVLTNQVVKMDKRILSNFENLEWISF